MSKSVAIIGAGPAGLATLRHLAAIPDLNVICFEQNKEIGGLWNYYPVAETCYTQSPLESIKRYTTESKAWHPAIYDNLKTNLPKEVMVYPDFPYKETLPSYMLREHVREYLDSYVSHFGLLKFIKFNKYILNVEPETPNNPTTRWIICYEDHEKSESYVKKDVFDYVSLCTGHCSVPEIPHIPGLDEYFKGRMFHSRDYRSPNFFKDKKILLMGGRASAVDIAIDLLPFASEVTVSSRNLTVVTANPMKLPSSIRIVSELDHVNKKGEFVFKDEKDALISSDYLLLCTGYRYIEIMAQIGANTSTEKEEMLKSSNDDFEIRRKRFEGKCHQFGHRMDELQWEYNDEIAGLMGIERLSGHYRALYEYIWALRKVMPIEYRDQNFRLTKDGGFELK